MNNCQYCGKEHRSNRSRLAHEWRGHEYTRGFRQGDHLYPQQATIAEIARVKEHLIQPYKEEEFYPAMLYRGALPIGRVKSVYNYFTAALEIEMKSINEMANRAVGSWDFSDLAHLTGLHKNGNYIYSLNVKRTLNVVIARLLNNPQVMDRTPHLREYIEYLRTQRGYKEFKLTPIPRWSPHARGMNSWRYRYESHAQLAIPRNWPFISEETPLDLEGMDLLTQVEAAVPKSIPYQIREDLCQDLIVAVLEGQVELRNIRDAVQAIAKAAFRKFPMKYGQFSLEWKMFEDGATMGERLRGNVSSIGLCSRCENSSEDLKDGMCGQCWAWMEHEIREKGSGEYPGLPVRHGYHKRGIDRGNIADYLEDPESQDGYNWQRWEPPEANEDLEIRTRGKLTKKMKTEDEFIVGPRPARIALGAGAKKHVHKGVNYVYKQYGHQKGHERKGDEWEPDYFEEKTQDKDEPGL